MAKLIIEIEVDDDVADDLETTIDYMLDAGTLQDEIQNFYEDRLGAEIDFENITCYQKKD